MSMDLPLLTKLLYPETVLCEIIQSEDDDKVQGIYVKYKCCVLSSASIHM